MKKLLYALPLVPSLVIGQSYTEYNLSNSLVKIKAQSSYNRGYTGKNSVIAILDSGIDVTNTEFKNKILATKNFTDSKDIADKIGHGTHVAGIASASKNNFGIQGVAYDSRLIIGKISDDGFLSLKSVIDSVTWANKFGADVANLSVGFTVPAWELNPKLISPGVYATSFTNKGMFSYGLNPAEIAIAIPGEMVIVLAAGNDGTKYSSALTTLATATDSRQNLLLGGRVIVAGNYDPKLDMINPTSSGPQHLCQNTVSGVMNQQYCADRYRLWDFYILAPGTNIISTVPKALSSSGLAAMTGTSMAAPAVSGSVAIIHQMWPQMKGSNIVQLLLVTANKTIPNYNKLVHGQGLLDLDRATQPYVLRGIPTTGRLNGPVLDNAQPLIFTSGSASIGNTTGIMVVDSFERDYYINLQNFLARKVVRDHKLQQTLYTYQYKNPYVLFNNIDKNINVTSNNFTYNVFFDSNNLTNTPGMMELGYTYNDVTFKYGFMHENQTWLGNSLGSLYGQTNNTSSYTNFLGLEYNKVYDKIKVYGSHFVALTNTNSYSETINNIKNVYSNTYTMGLEYTDNNHSIGFINYKPVAVYKGQANLVAPVGLDNEFNIINQSKITLNSTIRETRQGLYYNYQKSNHSLTTYVEARNNYLGIQSQKDYAFGVSYSSKY